ncbi:PIR protein [Plasmodium vivax]|uniref:VIR protein n=1 Tax=Plasmodium vivax TaxID=5855 RepID=A0A565A4T4_PLAVI|nr:PIR protein [Plasmodium vivax]
MSVTIRTEWDRINKYITNADKGLKECYEKQYVKVKLNDEEKIKNFKKTCNRNRTCDNRATPAKKTTITKAPEQRNCKDRDDCKKETSVTDGVKAQSKLSSGASNPQSSERNVSQEQSQNKADLQKLRQESVASQSQTSIMPSGSSDGTDDKASHKIVYPHSTTSGVVETQEQPLKALVTSGISEKGSLPSDHSSQSISGETSDLTCTSTGKVLDTIGIQTNPNCGKTLDSSNPEIHHSAGKVVEGQTIDAQDVSKGGSDGLPPANMNSGSGLFSGEYSLRTSTNGEGNDTVPSGSVNTDSSEVSNAAPGDVLSIDVGTNSMTSFDRPPYDRTSGSESNSVPSVRGAANGIEIQNGQEHRSEHLCDGTPCSAEQAGELTDGSLDIYGKVINAIQSNPQIIKTSAPMGIALLLGLLFKYTPLWRVLTKKNRKKGEGINEELNSVLQEPSLMDDERSIPFSYGAFEYSSIDQNVY